MKVKVFIEGVGEITVKGPAKTKEDVGTLVAQAVAKTLDVVKPVEGGQYWHMAVGYPKK